MERSRPPPTYLDRDFKRSNNARYARFDAPLLGGVAACKLHQLIGQQEIAIRQRKGIGADNAAGTEIELVAAGATLGMQAKRATQ